MTLEKIEALARAAIEGGFEDNHEFASELDPMIVLRLILDRKNLVSAIHRVVSLHPPHSRTGIILRQALASLEME